MRTSAITGFHKLTPAERLKIVTEATGLSAEDARFIGAEGPLSLSDANRMIENVIGTFPLPLGVATNFLINSRDYFIPMVTEEASVVAAASHAAKIARAGGGFVAGSDPPLMIGQIMIRDPSNPEEAARKILDSKRNLLELANSQDSVLVAKGGGARDITVRLLDSKAGKLLITHLLVDCRDAMGANIVNTMVESVSSLVQSYAGGRLVMRIISNLALHRQAWSKVSIPPEALGGDTVVEDMAAASEFAAVDPYRCATHNKGIMNGICALAMATGNDTRAVESGAHAYASLNGYGPLAVWEIGSNGNLEGRIRLPLALGIVGGITSVHPVARIALRILRINSGRELAEVAASLGLAQNLGALRALVTEGIQKGHMRLHARNIAVMAGARGDEVDAIAERLVYERQVRVGYAKDLLDKLRASANASGA